MSEATPRARDVAEPSEAVLAEDPVAVGGVEQDQQQEQGRRRSRRSRSGHRRASSSQTAESEVTRSEARQRGRNGVGPVRSERPGHKAPGPQGQDGPSAGSSAGGDEARPKIGDVRPAPTSEPRRRRRRGGSKAGDAERKVAPVVAEIAMLERKELEALEARTRERRDALGRYMMCVHVSSGTTQIAVLEGRQLIEHWVSRAHDDVSEVVGNIYLGKVQNVLPGMEAAFVDIGTPKNAVLYRGDVRHDPDEEAEELELEQRHTARIEQLLRPGQTIVCQATKNPIGAKGARLTQEVSLPGRFLVFVPGGNACGISKRLGDDERKRLRKILEDLRPAGHGVIVRTAAEGASADELRADLKRLADIWARIEELAKRVPAPSLLYREPDLAVRLIREELNRNYRAVLIDDRQLWGDVAGYVAGISPDLAERVQLYDLEVERLPLFDQHHVHEQLHKALDRKVWLPSGGSIIIERTEALTVIDVNTGKNVGSSNLEETVFRNNLEAADEIARQLRLRDIGGIIVIDFIDMEIKENREQLIAAFRAALARDKTRTQVFDVSELGLVQMTRKRVSEGLLESLSRPCSVCNGRGIVLDESLL